MHVGERHTEKPFVEDGIMGPESAHHSGAAVDEQHEDDDRAEMTCRAASGTCTMERIDCKSVTRTTPATVPR